MIDINEAASRAGCGYQTVYREVKAGSLPAYKPGKRILIKENYFDAWMENSRVKPRVKIGRPRKGTPRREA